MNTDNDIELHELEAIEQRMDTEGATSQERAAVTPGSGFASSTVTGFEAA